MSGADAGTSQSAGLRQDFEAWCGGEPVADRLLEARCQAWSSLELRRADDRGLLDPGAAEDAVQVVLLRLSGSRQRKLQELALNRSGPDLARRCEQAALRGASRAELERELGRPLREEEEAAARPLADDAAVERYLRRALRNALTDALRSRLRQDRAHQGEALEPKEEGADPEVEELFLQLRQRYAREARGTAREAYPAALDELERVAREGGDARSLTEEELPGASEEELRRGSETRQRRWSRARKSFLEFLEEVPLPPEQRRRLADVALLASRELYLHRPVRSREAGASQAHGGSMPRPPHRIPLHGAEADREQALAGDPAELPYRIAALDELGMRLLRRGPQLWLESAEGSLLGPEGPARRLPLRLGEELRDLWGHRLRLEEGALLLWRPPAQALSLDPAQLRLPPVVRAAAESAAAAGAEAVAAGLALRFGEPASMAQALRGEDPLVAVDRWWAALTAEERSDCRDSTVALAGRLSGEARALAEEALPEEPSWQARLVALLEGRDRLASLEALLRRCSPSTAPREAVDALDRELRSLCDLCYAPLPPMSPLLRLVGQRGAGWWADPGRRAGAG